MAVHPHGTHTCYCPNCGYKQEVGENVKCNTIYCCECGDRMRAVDTGERRTKRASQKDPEGGQGGSGVNTKWVLLGVLGLGAIVVIAKNRRRF